MYDMKALYEAESVQHAVQLRLEHPEAQIIAGGSDVLVQMREGKRAGKDAVLHWTASFLAHVRQSFWTSFRSHCICHWLSPLLGRKTGIQIFCPQRLNIF